MSEPLFMVTAAIALTLCVYLMESRNNRRTGTFRIVTQPRSDAVHEGWIERWSGREWVRAQHTHLYPQEVLGQTVWFAETEEGVREHLCEIVKKLKYHDALVAAAQQAVKDNERRRKVHTCP